LECHEQQVHDYSCTYLVRLCTDATSNTHNNRGG
jgi:hypothetical protein